MCLVCAAVRMYQVRILWTVVETKPKFSWWWINTQCMHMQGKYAYLRKTLLSHAYPSFATKESSTREELAPFPMLQKSIISFQFGPNIGTITQCIWPPPVRTFWQKCPPSAKWMTLCNLDITSCTVGDFQCNLFRETKFVATG